MKRRTFLETMTGATAATLLSRNLSWAAAEHRIKNIGLQVYTVRSLMQQDMDGTLAKVAAIGYREVEGPLLKLSAQETKATLDRHDLVCPSIHRDYDQMGGKWPQTLEFCNTIGAKYVVISWIEDSVRNSPDGFEARRRRFQSRRRNEPESRHTICLPQSLD